MSDDLYARCTAMITQMSDELGWNVSATQQESYAAEVCKYLPADCSNTILRKRIGYYHQDHDLVAALSANDAHAWNDRVAQVGAILRSAHLTWSSDAAVDGDDMVQVACAELIRSIPTFRYDSRFSTWAYKVIVRGVQRSLRDSQAQKRAARPDSLDLVPERDIPAHQDSSLETETEAHVLIERINAILAAQSDGRLVFIFHLWAVHDFRVEEIGQMIQLHPSRVRALLALARAVLREHPDIDDLLRLFD